MKVKNVLPPEQKHRSFVLHFFCAPVSVSRLYSTLQSELHSYGSRQRHECDLSAGKTGCPKQEHYISYYQLFILDIFLRHHAGRQIPLAVRFDAPEKLTANEVLVVSKMMGGHEHFYRRGENCASFAENSFFLILYGPEN